MFCLLIHIWYYTEKSSLHFSSNSKWSSRIRQVFLSGSEITEWHYLHLIHLVWYFSYSWICALKFLVTLMQLLVQFQFVNWSTKKSLDCGCEVIKHWRDSDRRRVRVGERLFPLLMFLCMSQRESPGKLVLHAFIQDQFFPNQKQARTSETLAFRKDGDYKRKASCWHRHIPERTW